MAVVSVMLILHESEKQNTLKHPPHWKSHQLSIVMVTFLGGWPPQTSAIQDEAEKWEVNRPGLTISENSMRAF